MFCTSVTPFLITFELTGQFQMDLTDRTENSKIITTVFMKIGSEVEEGDRQASQPREGLQTQFRSCWTQVEPCKSFPKMKVSFRPPVFLGNISRDMANSWETRQLVQPLEKLSKAKLPHRVSLQLLSLSSAHTSYYKLSTFLNYQGLAKWKLHYRLTYKKLRNFKSHEILSPIFKQRLLIEVVNPFNKYQFLVHSCQLMSTWKPLTKKYLQELTFS